MPMRYVLMSLMTLVLWLPCAKGQEPDKKDEVKQEPAKQEARSEAYVDAVKKVLQKAQEEYRIFLKEPKTVLQCWAAVTFEIQVGKFDIAAFHIKKMLELPEKEGDEDLLKIEAAEGLNTFLRLRLVREWSSQKELEAESRKNVDALIDRVLAALDKKYSDPERLQRFIDGLSDKVPEVRAFSLYQLQRAKQRAAPVLAEVLRTSRGQEQAVLKRALVELDPDIMPPLLELYRARNAKEASDTDFLLNLLWLAKSRLDKRVVPFLWHMSEAPQYAQIVRDRTKDTLAYLLDTTPDRLPPAKVALTRLAEQYYQYKVRFPDVTEVADRDNPAKQLPMPAYKMWFVNEDGHVNPTPEVLRPDDARFEFGLRYARQALELDKGYQPAQALYLALLLEADFARKPVDGQLDKLIGDKRPSAMQRLLAKIDLDLLTTALERAALEQNYAVLLPLIDVAGERGEVRLAQSSGTGSPGVLPKLLYYPDRRVQYAAARALLKMPVSPAPVASTRIVDVLSRFLATDPVPKVLIVYAKDERAAQLRDTAKEAGFESDVAATINDAMNLLHKSAGYDAIILNDAVAGIDLPYVLNQLRSDGDVGRLPLLLVAGQAKETEMRQTAARLKNAFLLPEVWALKGPELKRKLEEAIKFAAAAEPLRQAPQEQQGWLQYEVRRAKGQALSPEEKKRFARESLDWFAQMARGELPGYDLASAKDALLQAVNNDETAVQALRILARNPSSEIQQRLAGILLDSKKAALHVVAAQELNRHIQKNGLTLPADQVNQLRQLEQKTDMAPELRVELAAVIGSLRTTPQMTGSRLLNFGPDPEVAPLPKKDDKQH